MICILVLEQYFWCKWVSQKKIKLARGAGRHCFGKRWKPLGYRTWPGGASIIQYGSHITLLSDASPLTCRGMEHVEYQCHVATHWCTTTTHIKWVSPAPRCSALLPTTPCDTESKASPGVENHLFATTSTMRLSGHHSPTVVGPAIFPHFLDTPVLIEGK